MSDADAFFPTQVFLQILRRKGVESRRDLNNVGGENRSEMGEKTVKNIKEKSFCRCLVTVKVVHGIIHFQYLPLQYHPDAFRVLKFMKLSGWTDRQVNGEKLVGVTETSKMNCTNLTAFAGLYSILREGGG